MNKMLVAVFDTESAAYEGLHALKELHREGDITLYATVVLTKDSSGTVRVQQMADRGPLGTALGVLSGSVVGLAAGGAGAAAGLAAGSVAGPVGAALGFSMGGLAGLIADMDRSGVNVDLMDDVSKALLPGKSAVLAEVQETWEAPVDTTIGKLGGMVFRRLRSEVVEDQLARESAAFDAELTQLDAELAQATAERKAALHQQIAAVEQKLEVTRTQAEARAEQAKHEMEAKTKALHDQMEHANDRQKARIERRMAEVKAEYEARSAKLAQARKLVREAVAP